MKKILPLLILFVFSSCSRFSNSIDLNNVKAKLLVENRLNNKIIIKGGLSSYNDSLVVLPGKKVFINNFFYKKDSSIFSNPIELNKFDKMHITLNDSISIYFKDINKEYINHFPHETFLLEINPSFLLSIRYKEGKTLQDVYGQFTSISNKYKIQVLSPFTNYPYGKVKYQLVDSTNNILWKKELSSKYRGFNYPDIFPFISNKGTAVIIQPDKILVIDKVGNILTVIRDFNHEYNVYHSLNKMTYIPLTSDENFFFYFYRDTETKKIFLICYSLQYFREKWRSNIESINFPGYLRATKNFVITYYIYSHKAYYQPYLSILVEDISGDTLLAYKRKLEKGNRPSISFDDKNKLLNIKYKKRTETFFIQ